MNLIVGSPWWLIAFVVLALIAAAIEDTLRLRISNATCLALFGAALVAMGIHGFSTSLWQNWAIAIAILAIGTPAFSAGWFGGGDVKLLSAIGLWINLRAVIGLISAVFIIGGVVALIYIFARRFTRSAQATKSRDHRVPYGLAIVAGAVFVFATQLTERPSNPFIERMRTMQSKSSA
jgi:prepilin peptidase CpaA